MSKIPPEQLLAEIEDILRTMPTTHSLGVGDEDALAWLGRAAASVHEWDFIKGASFDLSLGRIGSRNYVSGIREVRVLLHQARHDLRMKTVGPLSVNLDKGAVFDYFDEVRQVIELARTDVLFIDPYLDAEFVSRYLPHVCSGVTVRLLGRERMASLTSAVGVFRTQSSLAIEVRSAQGFHDRYLLVDGITCHQTGASFKDGAKKAPTTLTQITDAFAAVQSTYEAIWSAGTPHS